MTDPLDAEKDAASDNNEPPVRPVTTVPEPPTLTLAGADQERSAELSRQSEQPPARVVGFTIIRRLGSGAYGSVWLAREQNTGKQFSIKFYTHRRGLDWSLLNREVEKLAELYTSRNIVRLHDVGWDSDPPYYIMEYLENGSLAGLLSTGPLPTAEALRIAKSVLHALVEAHGRGILHCDLKPANVLLDAEYEPRLCDFGQSRLSNEQSPALGTLFYMAPEQADLKAVPDARWDVYALGALFYHMLTGEAPFRSEANEEAIRTPTSLEQRLAAYRRALKRSPKPMAHRKVPGVDRRLAEIIDRCLHLDPSRRFPNAQAVLDAILSWERFRARRPLLMLGVVGPLLLLAAMFPLARKAMKTAVSESRESITLRALESDALSAKVLSSSLARDLDSRKLELLRIADDKEFRRRFQAVAVAGWKDRSTLTRDLDLFKTASDTERDSLRRTRDTSWLLADQQGVQRWRNPADSKTYDINFNYRDYFHGRGPVITKDNVPADLKPIREPHVSNVFRSRATKRYMVAISVPIWNLEETEVIGVLASTTHIGSMLGDYADQIRSKDASGVSRVVSLVEAGDWKLLDHPWLTEERSESLPAEDFNKLTLDERLAAQLSELMTKSDSEALGETEYVDPVSKIDGPEADQYDGGWLAAFSRVAGSGWIVVVQERTRDALHPVTVIESNLIADGLIALFVWVTLVPLILIFIVWFLSDRNLRITHRRGLGRSGSSSAVTGTASERTTGSSRPGGSTR